MHPNSSWYFKGAFLLLAAIGIAYVAIRASRKKNGGKGWLGPIHGLLTFLLVMNVLYLVGLLLGSWGSFSIGQVPISDVFSSEAYMQRNHQELSASMVAVSPFPNPSFTQKALYATGHGLAGSLAMIPMIIFAQRLIRQAHNGDPFTPTMVRQLRILGSMVLGGGALSTLVSYIASVVLLDISLPKGISRIWSDPDLDTTIWWLLPGLAILAFAEIINRGCALRNELNEVI